MLASLVATGALVGNVIAASAIAAIIATWSWHAAFGFLGVVGLVWRATWLMLTHKEPPVPDTMIMDEFETHLSNRQKLRCCTALSILVVGFFAYGLLTVVVVLLPTALSQTFGYTQSKSLDHDAGCSRPDHYPAGGIGAFG